MKLLENKTILIVGLGLIGGSIARGLSAAVPGVRILAQGRDPVPLQEALQDGNIHAFSTDISTLAPQADIIVLCTPTLTVRRVLEQLSTLVGPDAVITDAASVKGNVVSDGRRLFAGSLHRFVPGHPIAGSEQSGYKASKADLFQNRKVILTPLIENSTLAVRTVMQLWQILGADVHAMSTERHDEVLAGTSHLPHLLAYTLVNTLVDTVSEPDKVQQVFDYAAGGFADFSRIASSDPYMWRDIFLANTHATVDVLDAYIASLNGMRQRLLKADGDGMQAEFARAKWVRDEFIRRFRPTGLGAVEPGATGFTRGTEQIFAYPGSALRGIYRPAARLDVALDALDGRARQSGVSHIEGFPESLAALQAVHHRRQGGIPIVGPERGVLCVYGQDSAQQDVHSAIALTRLALPADPLLVGLLALAASVLPGSMLRLQAVTIPSEGPELERVDEQDSLLVYLQQFGAVLRPEEGGDVLCLSAALSAAQLDLSKSCLSDAELMVLIAAAALAQGESEMRLASGRAERLLPVFSGLADWAMELRIDQEVLRIIPRQLQSTELTLGAFADAELSAVRALLLIVMAQKLTGGLVLRQPGDVAAYFPGLLQLMKDLGIGITIS